MALNTAALQREIEELRQENAALLEALRLAQRGGADLRGHLSKWNPDARVQGIFSQDWELRYFVLSGTLLKYYSSERDVGYDPRGVLELQDCSVLVELPVKSSGPFIFQITDPDDELLLRLSADNLATAKTWVRTLAAAGLSVQGFERLQAGFNQDSSSGLWQSEDEGLASHKSAPHLGRVHGSGSAPDAAAKAAPAAAGFRQRLAGLSRALSGRVLGYQQSDSGDSDVSVMRVRQSVPRRAAAEAEPAAAQGERPQQQQQEVKRQLTVPVQRSPLSSQQQLQGLGLSSSAAAAAAGDEFPGVKLAQLQHMGTMSIRRSCSGLMRSASSRRWEKEDLGDELPSCEDDEVQSGLRSPSLKQQLSSTGSTSLQARPTMPLPQQQPSTIIPAAAAAGTEHGQLAHQGSSSIAEPAAAAAAAAGNHRPGRPRRQQMDGASPVHVAVKDSPLTVTSDWGVTRHEGLLNLGVVVLVATNIRLVMSNLFTYGLRLQLDPSSISAAIRGGTSPDDAATLAAIPGCVLFAAAALLIEWLGVKLMQREDKMRLGLLKKDESAAAAAAHCVAAAAALHEWLLFLLNLVNVAASLLLPCCMVLLNKSSLLPASALTITSIVTCMKLTTYAHCNTTLRGQARDRAMAAATGAGGSGSSALEPEQAATAAAEQTPFATTALPKSLAPYSPLNPTNGQVVNPGEVVYPDNLNPGDLAYFMLAPTLTYQLNFPRIRRRRPKLLARWLGLLLVMGLLMSFMQVQFLLPCMQSSLVPLREMALLRFTERLLRLSLPNLAAWLVMFYVVFHLWLNILGEVLLFGDRVFYKEWWNAATLADYWKLWNIPVHKFMLRTIFFPLLRRGTGKFNSMLVVFFVSAVMHELAVAVPLRMLRGWAFLGMFLQVPLISLTELLRKRIKSDSLGNMVFWASFCVLGQPMCLILYYHDWLMDTLGMQGLAKAAAAGAGAAAGAAAAALAGDPLAAVAAAAAR